LEKIATRDAYGKALIELGRKYNDVLVLDADLSKSTKTIDFAKAFPERFINAGIAEQNMIGMAAGLAASGKKVFASSFAIFATGRAFEQIRNSLAYGKLDVTVAATHAGITVGEDGGSHQAVEDIALMRSVPNMKVIVPADAIAVKKALTAIYESSGPCYLRLGRPQVPVIYDDNYDFQIGKGSELKIGNDAVIVACGIMVEPSLQAAALLENQGINVGVIDMYSIKPLDEMLLIQAAKRSGAVLTVEEHNIIGGLGSAVCETVCSYYPVPVLRMGLPDVFGQSGKPDELLDFYGLNVGQIMTNIHKLLNLKG
jgi:transketolase